MRPWFACNGFAMQVTYSRSDDEAGSGGDRPGGEAKRGMAAASRTLERCRRAGLTPDEED